MRHTLAPLLAAALLLTAVAASSGCISVYWLRDAVKGGPEKAPGMADRVKVSLAWQFTTDIYNSDTWVHQDSNTTAVKNGTAWMRIEVGITMQPIPPSLQPYIPNGTFNRQINLTIGKPDGSTLVSKTYNETQEERIVVQVPVSGPWTFAIGGMGIGANLAAYHDGYSLKVTVREPR